MKEIQIMRNLKTLLLAGIIALILMARRRGTVSLEPPSLSREEQRRMADLAASDSVDR